MRARSSLAWRHTRPSPRSGFVTNRASFQFASPRACLSNDKRPHTEPHLLSPQSGIRRGLATASHESFSPAKSPNTTSNETNRLRPRKKDLHNPEAWINVILPHLPANLRTSSLLAPENHCAPDDLFKIISYAWGRGVDVIAHLGLQHNRWEAVQWIVQRLLNEAGALPNAAARPHVMSNLPWPTVSSLDESLRSWTALKSLDDISSTMVDNYDYSKVFEVSNSSIDSVVDHLMLPSLEHRETRSKDFLGRIWRTLGNLLIAASNSKATQDHRVIMSNVLRIIASLHHGGYIPEAVYQYEPNPDTSALQQPPLLYNLSATMMSSLSEATYLADHRAQASVPRRGYKMSRIFSRTANKVPDLGPELWMEFCLWCCVHGGWIGPGTAILDVISRSTGSEKWSLICWRDIMESPDEKWEEYIQQRLQTNEALHTNNTNRRAAVQRTISAEVVVATIDALVSDMLTPGAIPSLDAPVNPSRLLRLKSLLERDHMSLGISSWDSILQRIADSSKFSVEGNPMAMEAILGLAETYGRELSSANVPKPRGIEDNVTSTASYVFDASAIAIGLYHRTLHAFVRGRDAEGAVRVLEKLQVLTDENKRQSLADFFAQLQATPEDAIKPNEIGDDSLSIRKSVDFRSVFPGEYYPSCHPNIPVNILADLLDLLVDVGNFEMGLWMIHSDAADGPLIPQRLYNDQFMAPALVRFASVTSDALLLAKVTKAQDEAISGSTLLALCESKIRQGDVSGAKDVLELMKQYALHEWKSHDTASLVCALLPGIFVNDKNQTLPKNNDRSGLTGLLRSILNAEHLRRPGHYIRRQLDTMVAMLSSVDQAAAQVCAGLLPPDGYYRTSIETKAFNTLLHGVVRSFGPKAARQLFDTWCTTSHSKLELSRVDVIVIPGSKHHDEKIRQSPAIRFKIGDHQPRPNTITFDGKVPADVDTIRVLIGSVLLQGESASADVGGHMIPSTSNTDVAESEGIEAVRSGTNGKEPLMAWATRILRDDFNLDSSDTAYITQNYSQFPDTGALLDAPYSLTSLHQYQVFSATRRDWAKQEEQRLRDFASSFQAQLTIANLPSAECYFIQNLAKDFGIVVESYGEGQLRDLKLTKEEGRVLTLPARTIDELLRSQKARRRADAVVEID